MKCCNVVALHNITEQASWNAKKWMVFCLFLFVYLCYVYHLLLEKWKLDLFAPVSCLKSVTFGSGDDYMHYSVDLYFVCDKKHLLACTRFVLVHSIFALFFFYDAGFEKVFLSHWWIANEYLTIQNALRICEVHKSLPVV